MKTEEQIRAEFEAWYVSQNPGLGMLSRFAGVEWRWHGWQARQPEIDAKLREGLQHCRTSFNLSGNWRMVEDIDEALEIAVALVGGKDERS